MSYNPGLPNSMKGGKNLNSHLASNNYYISFAELYIWCLRQNQYTEEGELYHDELTKFTNAFKKIAKFFDGSLGTYIDPVSKETKNYPTICDQDDLISYYYDAFNTRYLYFPVYQRSSSSIGGTVSVAAINNGYHNVNEFFCRRVDWFCKFKTLKYIKLIQTLGITYNPLADFWKKSYEEGGGAPQATITQSGNRADITDWGKDATNDAYPEGRLSTSRSHADGNNLPTTKNYTTTYDDKSEGRLSGYSTTQGQTVSDFEGTNSAYFKQFEEEGNKGSVILEDMIQKEIELAPFWDIVIEFCSELNHEILLSIWD